MVFKYLEEWGNGRANEYFEANVPSNVVRPKDGDSVRVVEKYIRDKYEHKRFIAKVVPPRVGREVEEEPEPVARRTTAAKAPVKQLKLPANVPVPVAPVPVPDLLNLMDDPVVAAPVSAAPAASVNFGFDNGPFQPQQQQQQQQFGGFTAFDEPPRPPQQAASNVSE